MDSLDLNELKDEVSNLITNTQQAFAYNYADTSLQQKLHALLALKKVLDTQTLPPQQLEAIRNQIRASAPPAPVPAPVSAFAAPAPLQPINVTPQPPPTPSYQPPASAPPMNLAQMLASFRPGAPSVVASPSTPVSAPAAASTIPNLADLINRLSTPPQQASTPVMPPFHPPLFPNSTAISNPNSAPVPAPTATPSAPAPANLAQLLASFNKAPAAAPMTPTPSFNHNLPPQVQGLGQLLPQSGSTAPPPNTTNAAWLLNALSGLPNAVTPSNATPVGSEPMTRQSSAPANLLNEVELTTASMKQYAFSVS